LTSALFGAVLAAVTACSSNPNSPDLPTLPGDPPLNPAFKRAAFIFDVSTSKKTINITVPEGITASLGRLGIGLPASVMSSGPKVNDNAPVFSLVGGDVISLSVAPGSYSATGVGTGGAPPGKVLVKFSVQMTNLLSSVQLIRPTFPIPPSST